MRVTILFLYLFLFSLVLGQLGALGFSEGAATIYLSDLLLAALLVVWWLESLLVERSLKIDLSAWPIVAFSALSLLSLLLAVVRLSPEQTLFSSFYWWRWVLYALLFFVVADLRQKIPSLRENLPKILITSGVLLALAGFVQLLLVPDFGLIARDFGWDPHRNRLLATFFDPNFTGAYLALTLALLLPKFLGGFAPPTATTVAGGPPARLFLNVVGLAILLTALLLTFSRSAWLLFGVIVGMLGLLRWRWLLFLSLLLAFSAYFFVPRVQTRLSGVTDPADSAHFRLLSWQKTVEIARDYLWTGVGFNAFRYAQADYGFFDYRQPLGGHAGAGSDSSWLLVLATTGVFGFLAYLTLYFSLMWKAWRGRREVLGLSLLAVLIGLIFEANFINSLFFPPIMAWLWVVAGLL